ncbi:MAG: S41 family peptidase [Planctomycetota bacterium]
MFRQTFSCFVGFLLVSSVATAQNPFDSSQPGYPRWSPFSSVKWDGGEPSVEVDGKWYQLISVHGVTPKEILAKCEAEGWPYHLRFEEDLVQILRLMGKQIDRKTELKLIDDSGKAVHLVDVMNQESAGRIPAARSQTANPFDSGVRGYPKWSPFEAVRWKDDKPEVRVGGRWYTPISVYGVAVEAILSHSEAQGWNTQTRFTQDIVQMIRLMGTTIDQKTSLVLRDQSGKKVILRDYEMTIRRPNLIVELSREQLLQDLQHFEASLVERFAYLETNHFDYSSAVDAIRREHPDGVATDVLASKIQRVMMGFVDGHASVSGVNASYGYVLPFRLEDSGSHVVAVSPDRSQFLDEEFPFLLAMDHVDIDEWIRRASPWVAKGSAQLKRRRGLRRLGSIDRFRSDKTVATMTLTLGGRGGTSTKQLIVELVNRWDTTRSQWPTYPANGILDDEIGYLRLPSMDRDATDAIRRWLPKFQETRGLIIDVRGNGGGIRTPLLELAGYLMNGDDPPRIANVGKYRLAEDRDEDHLGGSRFMYRINSTRFGPRERSAIKEFMKGFEPQWNPPAEKFSDWHYLVLSKSKTDPRDQYENPVVVLMDSGCFSATDIFLGALKRWPNVTLMGQPSGGGSARSQSFRLPHSGISVRCASMASFLPTGKLYDTNGVIPDVVVEQPPEHFLIGGPDEVLRAAISQLTP